MGEQADRQIDQGMEAEAARGSGAVIDPEGEQERAPVCPYCGQPARKADNSEIYGRTYGHGRVWMCPDWPDCDSYIGCHPGTWEPLGRMANHELRFWKKQAHREFDSIWKIGKMTRSAAYRWMSLAMGMTEDEAHIGEFNVAQCKRLVDFVKQHPAGGREGRNGGEENGS